MQDVRPPRRRAAGRAEERALAGLARADGEVVRGVAEARVGEQALHDDRVRVLVRVAEPFVARRNGGGFSPAEVETRAVVTYVTLPQGHADLTAHESGEERITEYRDG